MSRAVKEALNTFCIAVSFMSFWIYLFSKTISTFGIKGRGGDELFNADLVELICFCIMMPTLLFSVRYIMARNRRDSLKNQSEAETLKLRMSAIDKSNAVIEFCPYGNVLSVNKLFMDTFCYGNAIVGKHHSILMPDGMAQTNTYKKFWEDLRKGESKQGEFHRIDRYGRDVYIMGTYVPIWNKRRTEVVKILKLAQNNTEKFKAFEEIHNKNVYLEHAAKILRHDMHSGINTYMPRGIKSLKRRLGDDKIKELKIGSPLKLITEGLSHTQEVYKGVFEFTNLVKEGAKLETERLQLDEVLQCYLKRTSYSDKVKVDWLPRAEVNPSLFCTAVDNLIRNGLKYNDSTTKWVKISFYQEKDSDGLYDKYIFIEDNGRGMTMEEFLEFSKPYVRKKGQTESGSGLGLNICTLILKEHGFTISCEKTDNGTKLSIKL